MPNNRDRAEWVRDALSTYCERTRHERWNDYTAAPTAGEIEANQHEVISDFVCDLMHLVDDLFGGDFDGVLTRARNHYVEEIEEGCDCDGDLLPGAFYPVAPDGDESRAWVQRCDNCQRFASDEDAARALAAQLGVKAVVTLAGRAYLAELAEAPPWGPRPLPFGYGREEASADAS